MAEDWLSIAREVAEAIDDVGYKVTLRRTAASVDTTRPWLVASDAITDFEISVVSDEFKMEEVDGQSILLQDRKLIVAAKGVVPTSQDRVVIGTDSFEIVRVKPLQPGGVAVLFELMIRS